MPDVVHENTEVQDYLVMICCLVSFANVLTNIYNFFLKWATPKELLDMATNRTIELPPPQYYELTRLSNWPDITVIADFAKERNKKGLTLFRPTMIKTKDGHVFTLPGCKAKM